MSPGFFGPAASLVLSMVTRRTRTIASSVSVTVLCGVWPVAVAMFVVSTFTGIVAAQVMLAPTGRLNGAADAWPPWVQMVSVTSSPVAAVPRSSTIVTSARSTSPMFVTTYV